MLTRRRAYDFEFFVMNIMELPAGEFVLDSRITLWAMLPISLATLAMVLLRRSLSVLWTEQVPQTLPKIRDAAVLGRAANLRISGSCISRAQFLVRKSYFVNKRSGVLLTPKTVAATTTVGLMSPQTLTNQVVGVMSSILPQMALGGWARYLFAGVTVCRLPFSLSERFRAMLQSGMEPAGQGVGVHYVSALSWYVLNLFGNSAVVYVFSYRSRKVQPKTNLAATLALNMNPTKVFSNERKNLLSVDYTPFLDKLEKKLLES